MFSGASNFHTIQAPEKMSGLQSLLKYRYQRRSDCQASGNGSVSRPIEVPSGDRSSFYSSIAVHVSTQGSDSLQTQAPFLILQNPATLRAPSFISDLLSWLPRVHLSEPLWPPSEELLLSNPLTLKQILLSNPWNLHGCQKKMACRVSQAKTTPLWTGWSDSVVQSWVS